MSKRTRLNAKQRRQIQLRAAMHHRATRARIQILQPSLELELRGRNAATVAKAVGPSEALGQAADAAPVASER